MNLHPILLMQERNFEIQHLTHALLLSPFLEEKVVWWAGKQAGYTDHIIGWESITTCSNTYKSPSATGSHCQTFVKTYSSNISVPKICLLPTENQDESWNCTDRCGLGRIAILSGMATLLKTPNIKTTFRDLKSRKNSKCKSWKIPSFFDQLRNTNCSFKRKL